MGNEIIEEFISGFCRTCNGMQTVTCEYIKDGERQTLDTMNCSHEVCVHHGACEIYKQAHSLEK